MDQTEYSRRRAMQVSGAAGIAALAGCTGLLGGDGGDGASRGYTNYAAPNDGRATVVYLDVETLGELDENESGDSDQDFEDIEDPLLSLVAAGVVAASFSGFTLQGAGLGPLLNSTREQTGFESEIEEWIVAGEAFVLSGSIDTDEITENITSEPESDFVGTQYERVEEMGGYEIYESAGETAGEGTTTIALSDSEIISASARAPVDRTVEAINGDRTRAVDEFDTFEWALSNGGDHQIVFAGHGESALQQGMGDSGDTGQGMEGEQQFPELTGAQSAAVGITYDGGGEIDGDAAVVFQSSDALEEVRSDLEESFGSEAEEQSFDFGDDRFSMSATYEDSEL